MTPQDMAQALVSVFLLFIIGMICFIAGKDTVRSNYVRALAKERARTRALQHEIDARRW